MTTTQHMRDRIADELNRTDLTQQINREINSALKHYESDRFSWNEKRDVALATTSAGERYYTMTADVVKLDSVKLVYNNSWIYMTRRSWDELEYEDRQVSTTEGIPHSYTVYGNAIRVWPVPFGSYTIQASYIYRPQTTSLTGSYTIGSITSSSTVSHNNRQDGWMTDGEELVRQRAKAAVMVNYLRDTEARAEAAATAPFLSYAEKRAYQQLADETAERVSTGRVRRYHL